MFLSRKTKKRSGTFRSVLRHREPGGRLLRASMEALEPRLVLSAVSWINPAGGDWSTAANWSGGIVPNVTQDAVINIRVSNPIIIDSANAVNSLEDSTASLELTGGSLFLAGASSVKDDVTISGGQLASAGNLTVGGTLSESNGVLTGAGTVTVDGLLTWTGGVMSGSGTTLAAGGLQLGQSDGNTYNESLDARTLQNAGSATWATTDALTQNAHSIFQNLVHATLTVSSGVTLNGTGTLDNQGTITVEAGSGGTGSLGGYFTNGGELEVSSGTLFLGGSGSVSGNTKVDAGATLQFGGTQYVFNSGAGLTGLGTVTFGAPSANPATTFAGGSSYSFSGATIIQNDASVVFDATASTSTLNESSGNLGGSGTLTVAAMTTWTGGTMSGSGITSSLGGLSLGASGDTSDSETLAGRMLVNAGAGVWYGPDVLNLGEDSTFLNYSNATLEINGGATLDADTTLDSSGTFENNGAVTVADGTATTLVQSYFLNSGTLEVASGTFQLGGGGACPWNALAVTAGFTVDSGASLLFGNNFNYEAYAFNSGAYISGAGSVTFASGVSANFAMGSTYNPGGETLIDTGGNDGANVVFTAGSVVGPLANLTIESGVVNFSTGATITTTNLNLIAGGGVGILTGSDTLDVGGLLTWTDGTMEGPGTTVAKGGLDLGLADGGYHDSVLASRTFINQGTANWVGSGEIDVFGGARFINQSGATFNEQTNDEIWSDIGVGESPSGLFDNQGRFVVEGGGTATMESTFDNAGQVEISSGTWELSGAGSATGDFTLDAGASLQLNKFYGIPYTVDQTGNFVSAAQINGGNASNVTLIDGSQTVAKPLGGNTVIPLPTPPFTTFYETGDDTLSSLDMTGGWLTVTGTLTVEGPMTWSGGYIAGPGTLIVEGGLTLGTGTSGESEALYGVTLINKGTLTLTDGDVFAQEDGATVENQINATINIDGDGSWSGGNVETIDNQGTIEKTAGPGTSAFNYLSLENDGAVTVSSGTLDLETGGTATGSFTADAGSTLELGHSSWAFNSTSGVTGAGTVEFPFAYWPSYFNSNSTYDVSGATQFDSQEPVDFLSGSHVKNLGSVTLESGTLDLSSSVLPAISSDSATSLTESAGVLTGSDLLTVNGQTNWTGGVMSGTGTTVTDGSMQPGLLLGASGDTSDVEYLTVRTLDVTGGGTLEPLDTLLQSYGSTFVNTATDTLDVLAGVSWETDIDTTATIDNQGALVVGAGTSTSTISGGGNFDFITNPGGIEVLSGTLDLACNGTAVGTLQASFTIASGCTLQFGGDFTLGAGAGVGGPGFLDVPSGDLWFTSGAFSNFVGTTTIDGGTVEYDDSAQTGTLNESSGDLTGTGTLTVTGPTVWTGGTMDGTGTTITQGTLQLGLAADTNDVESLSGRTLTSAGNATWAGGGSISQSYGATFVNEASASFTIDNDLTWSSDGTSTLANAGTLTKSADGGNTILQAVLNNTGKVQVQQGTLSLQGGSVVGGSYLVQAGAALDFGSDKVTTTSVALPSDFTAGPPSWRGVFSGSAQDNSGSGLASVGVSLFDGQNYYDGTAFQSPAAVFNAAALSASSWKYPVPATIFTSDLAYAAGSEAMDNAGGSEPSTITSILLIIFPTVTMTSPANGTLTNDTKPTLTATASESARGSGLASVQFEYSRNGGTTWNNAGSALTAAPFTFTFTTALADGTYQARAVAIDNAGNSTASAPVSFKINTVPPSVTMTAPANGTITNNTKPTLLATASESPSGSGLATVQFEYSSNGGTTWKNAGSAETAALFNFTFTTALADGTYQARAVATDNAGNRTISAPVPFTVVPPTPPIVTQARLLNVTVITGHGKHQKKSTKFAGFTLVFNEALNAASARNAASYQVLQETKKGRKLVSTPVRFSVSYSASNDSVSLTLAGKPTFTSGGKLILNASRLTDSTGDTLVGNTVFTILPKAKGIVS